MEKDENVEIPHKPLIDSILDIMMKNGIFATTMDNIASQLKISKRTLYEIFGSKENLVKCVIDAYNNNLAEKHVEIAKSSSNEIEALLKIFLYSRDVMLEMNVGFYNDMDTHFQLVKKNSRETQFLYLHNMYGLINQGMEKGLFRDNTDYILEFRMMVLQMESLKRMEETFPPDITLLDVYDTVCVSFMRGIASNEGMKILDNLLLDHPELLRRPRPH